MENWYRPGVEASRWLQAHFPGLQGLMAFVSELGRFEFYLALLPLVYWCVHKRAGRELAYVLAVSELVNRLLKHALRGPRPFWMDPALVSGDEAGYGVPSGHAQSAAVFYLGLALWVRRRWAWLAAIPAALLMGLSRVFLGDHFLHDVLAGLCVGGLLLAGYAAWRRRQHARPPAGVFAAHPVLAAVGVPLAFAAVYLALQAILGRPDPYIAWQRFLPEAERTSREDMATALGTVLGLGLGFALESRRVRFLVDGSAGRRIARYLVGMLVTLVLWRGLGALFSGAEPFGLALALRLLRYAVVGLWVSYYAPLMFVRLRLSTPEPDRAPLADLQPGGVGEGGRTSGVA